MYGELGIAVGSPIHKAGIRSHSLKGPILR
jgi:hypothetical protein